MFGIHKIEKFVSSGFSDYWLCIQNLNSLIFWKDKKLNIKLKRKQKTKTKKGFGGKVLFWIGKGQSSILIWLTEFSHAYSLSAFIHIHKKCYDTVDFHIDKKIFPEKPTMSHRYNLSCTYQQILILISFL